MAESNARDFLMFLVCSVAEQPDGVSIQEEAGSEGSTTFQVRVDPADKQAITDGDVGEALHTAFSAYTYKHRIRARLELLD